MINLKDCEHKIYSQWGEDGITENIIKALYNSLNNKFYVEIGTESGAECNTRILREKYNWQGAMFDATFENKSINLVKSFITKDNVIGIMKTNNVPKEFNLLSLDIDGNDFYVLHSILKNYTPDIIICEYNATHLPTEDKVIIYNEDFKWDGTNYFGASLLSFHNLLNKYNYSLVYTTILGVNAFFVKTELLKRKVEFANVNDIDKLYNSAKYGQGRNGGHLNDKLNRKYVSSNSILTKK